RCHSAHSGDDGSAGHCRSGRPDSLCAHKTHLYFAWASRKAGEDSIQLQVSFARRQPQRRNAGAQRYGCGPMRGVSTSLLVISLLGLPTAARAQADSPAPVSNAMPTSGFGFNLPTHLGTLTYSLSGSEMLETTSEAGASVDSSTALSGNLGYLSISQRFPFSMVYSGGLFFTSVPGNSSTETFQDLAVSQVAQSKSWVFVVSDSLSYLPGAPTTGLSGVAGVGDVGVFPVQTGIGPDQSILTNSGTRIANGVQGSATWQTTPSLDLEASGAWQVLHFNGGVNALNTDTTSANFGPNYRIDARTSVGADVNYSDTTFPS